MIDGDRFITVARKVASRPCGPRSWSRRLWRRGGSHVSQPYRIPFFFECVHRVYVPFRACMISHESKCSVGCARRFITAWIPIIGMCNHRFGYCITKARVAVGARLA